MSPFPFRCPSSLITIRLAPQECQFRVYSAFPGRRLVQGIGANGQNREPTSCRADAAPFDGLSSGHLAPAAALGGSAQGEPSDAGVNYVGACGALSGCEALPCDSPRLTAPGGMLLDEEGSRGGAAVGSDEESGGDSLSLLSPTREERDYSECASPTLCLSAFHFSRPLLSRMSLRHGALVLLADSLASGCQARLCWHRARRRPLLWK